MEFLFGMAGAFIGLVLAVVAIVLYVLLKVKKSLGNVQFNEVLSAAKNAKNMEMSEYARQKNVVGMTSILEPTILKDFPEFNKELLYSKTEKNLRKIFSSLETQNVAPVNGDEDLYYIFPSLEEEIKDLKSMGKHVKYDSVVFHRHAIKKYDKTMGVATVEISSTVEYYYNETDSKNKPLSKSFDNIKKQTRYTSKFVYVYDESKLDSNQALIGIHCPNCGAPLKGLDVGKCEYCMSHVEPINLKIWKMSSYKEDYK